MNFEDLIYDVKTLLNVTSDDMIGVEDSFLAHKINTYRADLIRKKFLLDRRVDPIWLDNTGVIDFTKVASGDDPTITYSSLTMGKATIPQLISLEEGVELYRISSLSRQIYFDVMDFNILMGLIEAEDERLNSLTFISRVGDALYIYPFKKQASGMVILQDPRDGYVLETEYVPSGKLVFGEIYKVVDGIITYNSVQYGIDDTFTCDPQVGTTFTGVGKVKNYEEYRKKTVYDTYPCSREMAVEIIIKVLTVDYGIKRESIPDLVNDASTRTVIIKQ